MTTGPHAGAIRVVLADDDPRVLAAAKDALLDDPDVHVVAALGDGTQVPATVDAERIDVVVMDLGMPGGGVQLVRELRSLPRPPGVLVVTAQDDRVTCAALVRAGARCVVSKYGVDVDLAGCVVRCHNGDVVLVGAGPAGVLDHLLAQSPSGP